MEEPERKVCERKRQLPSGSAATPSWQYFSNMAFYGPCLVPRKRKTNVERVEAPNASTSTSGNEIQDVWSFLNNIIPDVEQEPMVLGDVSLVETIDTTPSTKVNDLCFFFH